MDLFPREYLLVVPSNIFISHLLASGYQCFLSPEDSLSQVFESSEYSTLIVTGLVLQPPDRAFHCNQRME